MARPKGFTREDVLMKTIGLFWTKGFADTSLQDLERVTGLNKSSLYAEFKGKEDIFLQSLKHYLRSRSGLEILKAEPKGWANVERFLHIGLDRFAGKRGCLSTNSMREVATLPRQAVALIERHNRELRKALTENLASVMPPKKASLLAEVVLTYFSGLCIEENLAPSRSQVETKIANFLLALRQAADSKN